MIKLKQAGGPLYHIDPIELIYLLIGLKITVLNILATKVLRGVSQILPNDHILVFLISDFHMPIDDIEESLSKLTKHTIVPIVIWSKAEYQDLPNFGIMNLNDPESGKNTTLFLRKKLKAKIIDKFEQRKVELENIFLKYDSPPFFVEDKFNPLDMTQYFNEYFHA